MGARDIQRLKEQIKNDGAPRPAGAMAARIYLGTSVAEVHKMFEDEIVPCPGRRPRVVPQGAAKIPVLSEVSDAIATARTKLSSAEAFGDRKHGETPFSSLL